MQRWLIVLMLTLLSLQANDSTVDIKFELGMFNPDTDGTIENTLSTSDFNEDYKYSDLSASYFAIDTVINYKYIPNFQLSYFTMNDNTNAEVNATVQEETFTGPVSTTLDFSVLNGIVYQDFKVKGDSDDMFYSGDYEFHIGVNVKRIDWKFTIDNTTQNTWIAVEKFIVLPYLGFKYYLYDFSAYAYGSALAFGEIESQSYQFGIEYRVVENLYLGIGYIYEYFEAVEDSDTVEFEASGYKAGFKYVF